MARRGPPWCLSALHDDVTCEHVHHPYTAYNQGHTAALENYEGWAEPVRATNARTSLLESWVDGRPRGPLLESWVGSMTIDDYIANLPCGRPAAGLGPGNPPKPYPPLSIILDVEDRSLEMDAIRLILHWTGDDAGALSVSRDISPAVDDAIQEDE